MRVSINRRTKSAKEVLDLLKNINPNLTDIAEGSITRTLDKAAEDDLIIKTPNGNYAFEVWNSK